MSIHTSPHQTSTSAYIRYHGKIVPIRSSYGWLYEGRWGLMFQLLSFHLFGPWSSLNLKQLHRWCARMITKDVVILDYAKYDHPHFCAPKKLGQANGWLERCCEIRLTKIPNEANGCYGYGMAFLIFKSEIWWFCFSVSMQERGYLWPNPCISMRQNGVEGHRQICLNLPGFLLHGNNPASCRLWRVISCY